MILISDDIKSVTWTERLQWKDASVSGRMWNGILAHSRSDLTTVDPISCHNLEFGVPGRLCLEELINRSRKWYLKEQKRVRKISDLRVSHFRVSRIPLRFSLRFPKFLNYISNWVCYSPCHMCRLDFPYYSGYYNRKSTHLIHILGKA